VATLERRRRLLRAALAAESRGTAAARHKCFLSYHADDADEVADFIEAFATVFIPKVIGVSDADDFIDSSDTDYVMDCVREKYLTDSTVTIVMVGKCTWARRYVDWEIYSTLRSDAKNRRSGLMGVTLPSVATAARTPPARLEDNLKGIDNKDGYARWWKYPTSDGQLRGYIDDAFGARTKRQHLIDNTPARKVHNLSCA
jgi:MTH538 TIR-like domain (DUF1863)